MRNPGGTCVLRRPTPYTTTSVRRAMSRTAAAGSQLAVVPQLEVIALEPADGAVAVRHEYVHADRVNAGAERLRRLPRAGREHGRDHQARADHRRASDLSASSRPTIRSVGSMTYHH